MESHQHGGAGREGPQPASADEGMNIKTMIAMARNRARRFNMADFPLSADCTTSGLFRQMESEPRRPPASLVVLKPKLWPPP